MVKVGRVPDGAVWGWMDLGISVSRGDRRWEGLLSCLEAKNGLEMMGVQTGQDMGRSGLGRLGRDDFSKCLWVEKGKKV